MRTTKTASALFLNFVLQINFAIPAIAADLKTGSYTRNCGNETCRVDVTSGLFPGALHLQFTAGTCDFTASLEPVNGGYEGHVKPAASLLDAPGRPVATIVVVNQEVVSLRTTYSECDAQTGEGGSYRLGGVNAIYKKK